MHRESRRVNEENCLISMRYLMSNLKTRLLEMELIGVL